MAENFTAIDNDILEHLAFVHFSSRETQVVFALVRLLNGWHKQEDRIALSQIQISTGMERTHICHTLQRLERRRIVASVGGRGKPKSYSIQKDFTLWTMTNIGQCLTTTMTKTGNSTMAETGQSTMTNIGQSLLPELVNVSTKTMTNSGHYQRKGTKEITKKDIKESTKERPKPSSVKVVDEVFLETTRTDYLDLDVDHELKKCRLWCIEHNKDGPWQRRFLNWLDNARKFAAQDAERRGQNGKDGIHARHNQQDGGGEGWDAIDGVTGAYIPGGARAVSG